MGQAKLQPRLNFLLALSFLRLILSLSFLCSSVSEALFALSFSFLSEHCIFSASFLSKFKHLSKIDPAILPENVRCQTIFIKLIIGRAKRAPHCAVQSKFRMIYICNVGLSRESHTKNMYAKMRGRNAWAELRGPNTCMLKVSFGRCGTFVFF